MTPNASGKPQTIPKEGETKPGHISKDKSASPQNLSTSQPSEQDKNKKLLNDSQLKDQIKEKSEMME